MFDFKFPILPLCAHSTPQNFRSILEMSVDVSGCLPAPPSRLNRGAIDLLGAQILAYATGSSVAVVEVGMKAAE